MISIKIEDNLPEVLKQIAENETRSQGEQVEHWIKKEAKRLGIDIKKPLPAKP